MRKVGFCLGVILLGVLPQPSRADVGLPGLHVLSSDATSLTVEYDLPGYKLQPIQTPMGTMTRVRVDGLAATSVVGGPELPAGGAWVALPPVGIASLRVIDEEVERVPNVDVSPVFKPDFVPNASGALLPVRQFARDAGAYSRPGPYPEASAALEGEQWMRFQRVTALRLFPVRYEALSRTLVVSKRIVVRIDFPAFSNARGGGLDAMAAAGLEPGPSDDRSFEPVYGGAVLNYEVSRAWRARARPRTAVTRVGAARPLDIGTGNPEWRVRIDTTGVWRVSFAQLALQQWPAGIAIGQVVAFRRDTTVNLQPVPWVMTEVPIDVIDVNNNGVFDAGDFLVLPVQNWADRVQPSWYERRYGDYDMVWLSYKSTGTGLRVAQAPGYLGATNPARPTSFPSFRHYEKNYHYFSFPLDVTRDDQFHWTDGNEDRTPVDSLLADLLDLEPNGGSVHVRAQWIGHSNLTHILSADWVRNTDNLATNLWTDTSSFSRFSFDALKDFDAHNAGEGLNRLRISGRIDTGPTSSQAGLNFFEVTYPRRYLARNNRLEMNTGTATDTIEMTVDGFTSASAPPIYAYDVTDRTLPVRLTVDPARVAQTAAGWSATIQTVASSGTPRQIVAASDVAPLPDAAITRVTPEAQPLYLTPANGGDFVIVTYDGFEPQLEPLADFRRSKGISTVVAKAQDVYDEFNNGRKSYFAVRRLLAYALANWSTRFCLLVGDASEDAQGWLGTSDTDFLPVPVIQGPVGVAQGLEVVPSDNWYVLGLGPNDKVDTDLLADMVIGRWTAGSPAEAAGLVQKSIEYETTPLDAAWRNRAVLVADDQYSSATTFGGGGTSFSYCMRPSEAVFKEIDQNLESVIKNEGGYADFDVVPFYMSDIVTDAQVPSFTDPNCAPSNIGRDFETERQYVTNTVSPALFTLLNPGAAFVNFQGHGNAIQMTHEELWVSEGSLQDIDRIFNDHKPFFFSGYACHLNNFANIAERGFFGDAIGERMVNIPVKGAIGCLASVGYELLPSTPSTQLNVHVYRAFFVNPPYAPFAGQSGARVFIGEAEVLGTYRMVSSTFGLERLAARTYELLGDPLVAMNFGPPRFFTHATDRDTISTGIAYYPTLNQDSVTVETKVLDESKFSLALTEQGEGVVPVVPDSEFTITPPYPDTVGNRYTIRLGVTPRPASYDIVYTAKDRSGLTGQYRLRFVMEASLTQNGQVIRSGDPVVPGPPLVWKVHSPARLAATDFVAKMDDAVIPFTSAEDPTDTTGRTWSVTTQPALAIGPHKAALDVGLAKGGATRIVAFGVNGAGLALKDVYAFPNPFRNVTTFNFFVTSDQPADVLVRVFTVSGKLVWERFEKAVQPGYHQWEWDGRDQGGKAVGYGAYLFRVATGQGGDRKASEQGKLVRAPERKQTASTTTTP
jgi:hypothetical protein